MTTSNGDELPRDIELLFSRNRLNVAISRARCLARDAGAERSRNVSDLKDLGFIKAYQPNLPSKADAARHCQLGQEIRSYRFGCSEIKLNPSSSDEIIQLSGAGRTPNHRPTDIQRGWHAFPHVTARPSLQEPEPLGMIWTACREESLQSPSPRAPAEVSVRAQQQGWSRPFPVQAGLCDRSHQ